jgi:ABC-2 type transport system ATP-binding protein
VASVYQLKKNFNNRIKEIIGITGIGSEQNKKIGALSKGYRQRVGLAQALIHNPSVLILDEPTSGLDPNQIIEIRNLITDVGKEKTVMLSTHIMQEVEAICQRIIIINRGKLVADGTTSEILLNSSFTRNCTLIEFANSIPDNLLLKVEGVVDVSKVGEKTWLVYSEKNNDIRENLFSFAVNQGLVIIALQKKEKHLEEIFQSLTISK